MNEPQVSCQSDEYYDPNTKRCSKNVENGHPLHRISQLSFIQYILIAFCTIFATATCWEIIKRINTDLPILYFSEYSYSEQFYIMLLILLLIFFTFLGLAWCFARKFVNFRESKKMVKLPL